MATSNIIGFLFALSWKFTYGIYTFSRHIERNVAMELVHVTEAAALSAARFWGMGDKNLVDKAAVHKPGLTNTERKE
jgi:hypothetical protein